MLQSRLRHAGRRWRPRNISADETLSGRVKLSRPPRQTGAEGALRVPATPTFGIGGGRYAESAARKFPEEKFMSGGVVVHAGKPLLRPVALQWRLLCVNWPACAPKRIHLCF